LTTSHNSPCGWDDLVNSHHPCHKFSGGSGAEGGGKWNMPGLADVVDDSYFYGCDTL